MNNRRNLLIALGAGALTAPLVLRKSGGYAPNVHQPRRAFTLVVAVWAALTMASAAAAEYPTKPIRLMVPSAAGGTPDILARLIASELTKQMAQQVSGTNVLTVTPALPVRSARELIEYARAQPGKLSYGSIGGGGSQQLSIELFKSMTGTQIVQVSYKGMQQAITDTIAGQVHIVCDNAPSILPQIRAGRLRAIGVTGLKRIQAAPDIPTVAEAGVPGYEMAPSSGYVFPARTPRDIVLRMNAEINKALMSPAISEKIVPAGLVIAGGTPEQFTEHLHRETAKWAGVIKTAGIKVD